MRTKGLCFRGTTSVRRPSGARVPRPSSGRRDNGRTRAGLLRARPGSSATNPDDLRRASAAGAFNPWPHLLFTADTFEEYFASQGRERRRPAWVNGWTPEQYLSLFDEVGLAVTSRRRLTRPIDEPFLRRFEDELGIYPSPDLETDMLYVDLEKPAHGRPELQFEFFNAMSARHAWQHGRHLFIAPNPEFRGPVIARSAVPVRAIDTQSFTVRNEHPAAPPIEAVVRVAEADAARETIVFRRMVGPTERLAYSCRLRSSAPQFLEFRAALLDDRNDYAWLHFEDVEVTAEAEPEPATPAAVE